MFSLRSLAAAALIPATTITAFADAPAAVPVKKSRTAAQMSTFTLMDENDFKWSDKYYTNAIQLAYTSPVLFQENSAPDWLAATLRFTPLAVSSSTTPAEYRFHFGIAQEMYTAKYSDRYPPPGDHPFAGLLYSSFGLSSETADRLDVLELSLGVIGPGSLARQTQNEYHDLIGDDRFRGWPNQLRNEPLVQLAWERRYRVPLHREESFGIDLIPLIHLEAGTVRSYATSGSHLRLGWNLPEDFGVDTLRSTNATFRPEPADHYFRFSSRCLVLLRRSPDRGLAAQFPTRRQPLARFLFRGQLSLRRPRRAGLCRPLGPMEIGLLGNHPLKRISHSRSRLLYLSQRQPDRCILKIPP